MSSAEVRVGAKSAVLGADQRAALREAARAWVASRVLVWLVGVAAVVAFGANAGTHDAFRLTAPFGAVGNKLVAPAARWDSVWYLLIADHGYVIRPATQFYPLYPLVARATGAIFGSSLIGGILVSLASLLAALYLLRRLVALEVGEETAKRTMLLLAFFPTAVFFSAVYTEGLFLALTVGSFYAARRGRWGWAGVAGALASAARPTGIILVVPLLLLYLYGPRGDRAARPPSRGLRPRYRLGPSVAWLFAVPAGLVAYMVYLAQRFGDPFVMVGQGANWKQTFTFPLLTFARAAERAASGSLQVFHGHTPRNVYEFAFVCFACVGTIGAFRRLPVAYGAYAAAGVVFTLSFPFYGQSVASFSRYMTPLFPVLMWLAAWSTERRLYRWVLALFALAMLVNTARFATWHFVA